MRAQVIGALTGAIGLAGCTTSLEQVPRLAEVDLSEEAPSAELVNEDAPQEPVFREGLLSTIFGAVTEPSEEPAENADAIDAAVSEALTDAQPETEDVADVGTEDAIETALADGSGDPAEEAISAASAAVSELADASDEALSVEMANVSEESTDAPVQVAAQSEEPVRKPVTAGGGLFGMLRALGGAEDKLHDESDVKQASLQVEEGAPRRPAVFTPAEEAAPAAAPEVSSEPEVAEEPVVPPQDTPTAEDQAPVAAKPRRGLFAAKPSTSRSSATEPDVTPGAPLAFGKVGRVCSKNVNSLGRKVESFPDKGRKAFTLYDSAPGSIEARAFYISGFSDGCLRQVTAANAVFGAPSMHERLRYGLPSDTLPSSRTDEAYKRLKSKICGVSRSAPCGDQKIGKLERNTVFVTVYSSFTGNQTWSNLLLHDGEVFASDIKQAR